jgi:hypothetical protein
MDWIIGFINTLFFKSLLITIAYNNSTIELQSKTSTLTAEDSLHSGSRCTTGLILFCTTYMYSLEADSWKTHPLPSSVYMRDT